MSSEKPIHARVAEALGWTELRKVGGILIADNWAGWPPGELPIVGQPRPEAIAPRYDTDWGATGPLIEKYGFCIERAQAARSDGGPYAAWRWIQAGDPMPLRKFWQDTPLLAVCHLILALEAAGKLK